MVAILIVEDEPEKQSIYADIVYRVQRELDLTIPHRLAIDFEMAQQALERGLVDVDEMPLLILLDMELPYKGRKDKRAGYRLMQQYRESFVHSCWVPLIANITWHEEETNRESLLFDDLYKLQPFDVFTKDNTDELRNIVRRALRLYLGRLENKLQEDTRAIPEGIITFDTYFYAMSDYKLYHEIRSAAENTRDILLFGEPGTGKTLTAHLIHYYSKRRHQNFRSIDGMLEAIELEKILFPSNKRESPDYSLLGQVQSGTLYIANFDQMGSKDTEVCLRLQRKLLHYLKHEEYDVRIIGGINRSRRGFPLFNQFLPELLDVMLPLNLPPLQERKDDIPLLVEIFLRQFNRQQEAKGGEPKKLVDLEQIHMLLQAQNWWHVNVTELRMVVEEVLFNTLTSVITADDFKTILEANVEQLAFETIERTTETNNKRQVNDMQVNDIIEVTTEAGKKRHVKITKPPLIITDEDLRRFGIH